MGKMQQPYKKKSQDLESTLFYTDAYLQPESNLSLSGKSW